jgi:hypothetical protein
MSSYALVVTAPASLKAGATLQALLMRKGLGVVYFRGIKR